MRKYVIFFFNLNKTLNKYSASAIVTYYFKYIEKKVNILIQIRSNFKAYFNKKNLIFSLKIKLSKF